jgi:recombination protein RecA
MAKTKTTRETDEGADLLSSTIDDLNKKLGEGNRQVIEIGKVEDVECVPTGIVGLDYVLGGSGLPMGRIIEVSGAASSAKSSLCLHLAGVFQKSNRKVAWIDLENSLGAKFSNGLGVDMEKLIVATPETGEDAFKVMGALAEAGVELIVLDSVSAMVPTREVEGEFGDTTMASQARMMSQGLRKLNGILSKSGSTVVFINQVRDAMSASPYGPRTVTTGGKALPFYASVRLETARESTVKGEGDKATSEAVGIMVRIKNSKNKIGYPFRTESVFLSFGDGFDTTDSLVRMGERYGIVRKSGAWYYFGETKLGNGMENVKAYLNSDGQEAMGELSAKITERIS